MRRKRKRRDGGGGLARARGVEQTDAFTGSCYTAHRLPFPDRAFGGIVLLDVLHHLPEPVRFFDEAARLLRPGGRLALIEPGITPLSGPVYRLLHEEPVDMAADPLLREAVAAQARRLASYEDMLRLAASALDLAKRSGRNRCK